jgi:multidrug efflux system membrane fusion protein
MEPVADPAAPAAVVTDRVAERPRVSWRRALVWVLVLAGALAAGWFAWSAVTSPAPPPAGGSRRDQRPAAVGVSAATTEDLPVFLDRLLGTVTPLQTVTVKSRVDGQLLSVRFKEGQMVAEKEVLAEVDPQPFQVQLAQAQGQLARDQALLDNARLDLERYRTLLAEDSIEKQKLDAQESLVHQYEGVTAIDQAQIDNARLQLDYARITAPFSGRTGLRLVDAGNIVHAGDSTGIVVLTQMQPITVVFPIPQDDLPAVLARQHEGARLPVDAYDRQQRELLGSGELASIDNQIDALGMIRLKAVFANADGKLFPNQFVNVRMQVDVRNSAVMVPTAALQLGSKGAFVYVVGKDKTVALRPVQSGPSFGGKVAVTGVEAGELVVTDGTDRLREGITVQIGAQDGEAVAPRDAAKEEEAGRKGGEGRGKGGRRRGEGK